MSVKENKPGHISYSGEEQSLGSVVASQSSATISYMINDSGTWSTVAPTAKNVGEYKVSYKVELANYESIEGQFVTYIDKATNSFTTLTCDDIKYQETPNPTIVVKFGSQSDIEIAYTNNDTGEVSTEWNTENLPGTYKLSAYMPSTDNYTYAYQTTEFKVNPLTMTVAQNPATGLVYDGEKHELGSVSPTGEKSETEGFTIYYKVGEGEYSTDAPTATDAGTYTVGYKVEKRGYTTVESTFDTSIAKATNNAISNLACADFPYGKGGTPEPTATATFGTITYKYSTSQSGPFTD